MSTEHKSLIVVLVTLGLCVLAMPLVCCGGFFFVGMLPSSSPRAAVEKQAAPAAKPVNIGLDGWPNEEGYKNSFPGNDPISKGITQSAKAAKADDDLPPGYKYDPVQKDFVYKDNTGKTVHVGSYTRKDGTVVSAHDRAAPGAGGKGKGGGKGK